MVPCLEVFPFITHIAAGGPISPCLFPTVWRPEHALCWQRAGNLPAGSEEWINCKARCLSALCDTNTFLQQWPPEWGLDRSTWGFQHLCPSSWNQQYNEHRWWMYWLQISGRWLTVCLPALLVHWPKWTQTQLELLVLFKKINELKLTYCENYFFVSTITVPGEMRVPQPMMIRAHR